MSTIDDENLIRTGLAAIRQLEPSEAAVAAVVSRAAAPARRAPTSRPRVALAACAGAALLLVGAYAVPTTRAAIDAVAASVAEAFGGYQRGDDANAPGRSLRSDEQAPSYFDDHHFARDPRVIAEAGGYRLYAYISPSGGLSFDLGDTGVGIGFEGTAELSKSELYVLGPGSMRRADKNGHVPLFGLAARPVKSVELVYGVGPPLRVDGVDGGFVLLTEPARRPREVLALDPDGQVIGRKSIAYIGWRQYLPAGDSR